MTPIEKYIAEKEKEFDKVVSIIEIPLYEYHFTEGHENPRSCAHDDIDTVKSHLTQSMKGLIGAIVEEIEGVKINLPMNERDGSGMGAYNGALENLQSKLRNYIK